MNIKVISKYLVYLRQLSGYTQESLAVELGISRQAISKWETGHSLPDLDMLLKLSKLYDKTINELLEPHIENHITSFEEISEVSPCLLESLPSTFGVTDLVKASMGASPSVNDLLRKIFPDIDFDRERIAIGSVQVQEIEKIHVQIVSMINLSL